MITQVFSIGIITLFGAMLPGPDFAIVMKNALLYTRRAGIFTSIGVASAILVHMSYCAFGLAIVIYNSDILFNIIKYIGSAYLIYLGITSLFSKIPDRIVSTDKQNHRVSISNFIAFRQGFLCNLLNPKATLFFLALFTMVIDPKTPSYLLLIYASEVVLTALIWFCTLTVILSHPRVTRLLEKSEKYIAKLLGIFLIAFGAVLALASR